MLIYNLNWLSFYNCTRCNYLPENYGVSTIQGRCRIACEDGAFESHDCIVQEGHRKVKQNTDRPASTCSCGGCKNFSYLSFFMLAFSV